MKFLISSEDCELLLALEKSHNLLDLSDYMQRDVSVISRRLNKIKNETTYLEKLNGKWMLSSDGIRLSAWTKKAINEQIVLLNQKKVLRIATTREFASRILIPRLGELIKSNALSAYTLEILTTDGESEKLLLENLADVAIDCGTPYHPDIRFKKIVKEKMIIVSSVNYYKANKKIKPEDYLHFVRTDLLKLQEELNLKLNPKFIMNDLSSLKAAILNDLGYGLIPYYVVRDELRAKKLHDFDVQLKSPMSFGIWWKSGFSSTEILNCFLIFLKSLEL